MFSGRPSGPFGRNDSGIAVEFDCPAHPHRHDREAGTAIFASSGNRKAGALLQKRRRPLLDRTKPNRPPDALPKIMVPESNDVAAGIVRHPEMHRVPHGLPAARQE